MYITIKNVKQLKKHMIDFKHVIRDDFERSCDGYGAIFMFPYELRKCTDQQYKLKRARSFECKVCSKRFSDSHE